MNIFYSLAIIAKHYDNTSMEINITDSFINITKKNNIYIYLYILNKFYIMYIYFYVTTFLDLKLIL